MVLTPGFYQQTQQPRRRGRRERWVIWVGAVLVAAVIGVTAFSLSSSDGKSGHGCLNFTYAMVMGGEQFHACGAEARRDCLTPPHLGGLANGLTDRLKQACHQAGLPTSTASS